MPPIAVPRALLTREAVAGFCHEMWKSRHYPVHLTGDAAVLSDWLIEHGYDSELWAKTDPLAVHDVDWGCNLHFWFFWACPDATVGARSPVYRVRYLPAFQVVPNVTWGYPTYQEPQVDQCGFLFELQQLNLLPDFTPPNR